MFLFSFLLFLFLSYIRVLGEEGRRRKGSKMNDKEKEKKKIKSRYQDSSS